MKLAVVRIRGEIGVNRGIEDTLQFLNLRHINSCTLIENTPVCLGMLQKAKDYATWGPVSEESLMKILNRAEPAEGKLDEYLKSKKTNLQSLAKSLLKEKSLKELGLKPTIRLHPPRKGLKSIKNPYPRGDLGNRKEKINELLVRMR